MISFLSDFLLPCSVAAITAFFTTFFFDRFTGFFHKGKDKRDMRMKGPKVEIRQLPLSDITYSDTTYLFTVVDNQVQGRPNCLTFRKLCHESDMPNPKDSQYYLCTIRNDYDLACSIAAIDMGKSVEISRGASDGHIPAHAQVIYCASKALNFRFVTLDCGEFYLKFDAEYEGAPKAEFPIVTRKQKKRHLRN